MSKYIDNSYLKDESTNINFPEKVEVTEIKAPTDDSIRLSEEFHEKALKNIIGRVKIENNIVQGEAFLIKQHHLLDDLRLVIKFQINGKEYEIDKTIVSRDEYMKNDKDIVQCMRLVKEQAEAIILWWAMRHVQAIAYEAITNKPFPKEYL